MFKLILLTFSLSAHASYPTEPGFGKLISQVSTTKSVAVDDIQTRSTGSEFSHCARYEDDNRFDGNCLEWHSYCRFYVRFPGTDALGNAEEFVADPSFFDSTMASDAYNLDCEGLLQKWSQDNAGKTIQYSVRGNIYENTGWTWGAPNRVPKTQMCVQTRIIRDEVVSDGHVLFRSHPSSQTQVPDELCK